MSESRIIIKILLLIILTQFTNCRKDYRLPVVGTLKITSITHSSAKCEYVVIYDGGDKETEHGICWSHIKNPTLNDYYVFVDKGEGDFSALLTNLQKDNDYYVRAYVSNSEGTVYGNNIKFTTQLTVEDIDGNSYKIVTIGEQVWMKQDLGVKHYRNGDPIKYVASDTEWVHSGTEGAYRHNNYGCWYNGYAAIVDPRGICPDGWHVSTDKDWKDLEAYLGMSDEHLDKYGANSIRGTDQGSKIKSDTSAWKGWMPGIGGNGTNTSGFSAMPTGHRYGGTGLMYGDGEDCYWWSTDSLYTFYTSYYSRYVSYQHNRIDRYMTVINWGLCVRCVRDY